MVSEALPEADATVSGFPWPELVDLLASLEGKMALVLEVPLALAWEVELALA